MKTVTLARWMKFIIVGIALCGGIVYSLVVPMAGQTVDALEEGVYHHCYWPWLIMIWATGLPIAAALVFSWQIAGNIRRNQPFCHSTVRRLTWIARLAAGDALFFLVGNVVFLFMSMSHPGITLFSLLVVFGGLAIAIVVGILSQLVKKATDLQEQSDWTI